MSYQKKYLKYKEKYLNLKKLLGGCRCGNNCKPGQCEKEDSLIEEKQSDKTNRIEFVPTDISNSIFENLTPTEIIKYITSRKAIANYYHWDETPEMRLINLPSLLNLHLETCKIIEDPEKVNKCDNYIHKNRFLRLYKLCFPGVINNQIDVNIQLLDIMMRKLIGTKNNIENIQYLIELGGNPILNIDDNFYRSHMLTDISLPPSVITIGDFAFSENQLTNVVIPNSVITIGNGAFLENQLIELRIPESVTTIGISAFSKNQLTNIEIPNSVTTIGFKAFLNNQLTNIVIPNSVITIAEWTFSQNQLTNVVIPNSIITIKMGAFARNQLINLTIPNSVTTIDRSAFAYNKLTNLTIPDSVITIGEDAFAHNELKYLTIPRRFEDHLERIFLNNIKNINITFTE